MAMTVVTLRRLSRYHEKLIASIGSSGFTSVTRTQYSYTTTSSAKVSMTISGYTATNSLVEVYQNGLRLGTSEYSLSSAGVITTTNTIPSGNTFLVFYIHFS